MISLRFGLVFETLFLYVHMCEYFVSVCAYGNCMSKRSGCFLVAKNMVSLCKLGKRERE